MWRLALALLVGAAGPVGAQPVPGRDLLHFPIGLTAEPGAIGPGGGAGLWNPASAHLPAGAYARVTAGAMTAPVDLASSAQLGAYHRRLGQFTVGASVVHARVNDLIRTDTDPQSIGSEIPYSTTLASLGLARRVARHLTAGATLRWRTGTLDSETRSSAGLDVGVVADSLTRFDVRVAAGSFLLRPWGGNDRPALSVAADARVAGRDTARRVRAGVAWTETEGLGREQYVFADARWHAVVLRGGPVRATAFGASETQLRLGVAVLHAGYEVGVAREENGGGLSSTFQLTLSRTFR
jgi:hypothetical protein